MSENIVGIGGASQSAVEQLARIRSLDRSLAVHAILPLLAAAITIVQAGCQRTSPDAAPAVPPPPKVLVSKPLEMPLVETREYTGHLEAVESVSVRARVRGVLQEIHFEEGAEVQEGALLYEIDPREFQAIVDEKAADVERLEHELHRTELTSKRSSELLVKNATSREEWESTQAAMAMTRAEMEKAKASLQVAQLNLNYTIILAPISGRVGRTLVTEGNLVGYNEPTLLTTIVGMDPVYVQFEVPERDLLRFEEVDKDYSESAWSLMHAPLSVGLETEAGYPHAGLIDFRDNHVETETGTILVRGTLPNAERKLVPGLFARIRVPIGQPKPRLLVPETALAADQRGRYVLVVKADDTVEQRPVQIATNVEQKGFLPIREGLSPDDRVIASGLQRARPGTKVAPQLVNPQEVVQVAGAQSSGSKAPQ
jgi:multidrug efflux system membrane fusion protein